jgi:4-amino-4-deoxy-L-arabinose transferase-like glycosyltransferase
VKGSKDNQSALSLPVEQDEKGLGEIRTFVAFDSYKFAALCLVVVVLVGAFLRVFDVGAKSFWIDELLSLNHAKEITGWRSFLAPSSGDWHPPLYFLLLKGWLLFGEGESWARLLSVFLGIAVIPATFALARQFFSIPVSLLSSFLVAASPLFLLYDREVRNYPLFTLMSVMSLYFLVRGIREKQMRHWLGYTAFTTLAIYTHYHGFLLVLGEVVFVCLSFRRIRPHWKAYVFSLVAIGLLCLPLLPTLLRNLREANQLLSQGGKFPIFLGYPAKPLYIAYGFAVGQTILPWNPVAIVGGLVVLTSLAFSIKEMREHREIVGLFVSCLVLPVILGTLLSESMPRYYLFAGPLFYMLLAMGLGAVRPVPLRFSLGIALILVWGIGISNYYSNRQFHVLAHVTPWREVGQFLEANVMQGDAIIHVALKPKIGTEPLSYYAQKHIPLYGQEVLAALPNVTKGGSVPRVWLVLSEPALQEASRPALAWLEDNYSQCETWRYFRDPDFRLKRRMFRKDFAEYRIQVFRFEKPRVNESRRAVCQPNPQSDDDVNQLSLPSS